MESSSEEINIFDAHCHLQDYTEATLDDVLSKAGKMGIKHIMSNCCIEADYPKMIEHLNKYGKDNFVMISFGLHPWWLNSRSADWLANLKAQLIAKPESQLGEIGLDALKYDRTPCEEQIDVFEKQLQLGIELERVISVHCVRAQPEMLKVFKKYFKEPKHSNVNIVMHSYGGNKEMTKQYLKLKANIYFSLSFGIISRPENVKVIPLENLLIETDSPHQISETEIRKNELFSDEKFLINDNPSLEGVTQLNQPHYGHIMIDFLANLYSKPKKEIATILFSNSLKAFRLLK